MSQDPLDSQPENRLAPSRGRLLISEPYLSDPYFRRTVILLCEHDERGSFGFVLNRFIDIGVQDLHLDLPTLETRIGIGGPVQSGSLFYLHTLGPHLEGSIPVVDDIHMGGDLSQLRDLLNADPRLVKHVRFFIGYSGWGEGQLARELDERSWLVAGSGTVPVMSTRDRDLWREALRGMGGTFATMANFPEDPSLN